MLSKSLQGWNSLSIFLGRSDQSGSSGPHPWHHLSSLPSMFHPELSPGSWTQHPLWPWKEKKFPGSWEDGAQGLGWSPLPWLHVRMSPNFVSCTESRFSYSPVLRSQGEPNKEKGYLARVTAAYPGDRTGWACKWGWPLLLSPPRPGYSWFTLGPGASALPCCPILFRAFTAGSSR